jgi:hypothetical protein
VCHGTPGTPRDDRPAFWPHIISELGGVWSLIYFLNYAYFDNWPSPNNYETPSSINCSVRTKKWHKSKKSEMFGPNVADKYASAVTKNLCNHLERLHNFELNSCAPQKI